MSAMPPRTSAVSQRLARTHHVDPVAFLTPMIAGVAALMGPNTVIVDEALNKVN